MSAHIANRHLQAASSRDGTQELDKHRAICLILYRAGCEPITSVLLGGILSLVSKPMDDEYFVLRHRVLSP